VQETSVEAVTDVAHDVFRALIEETRQRHADLLLMGWHGGFTVGRIHRTPVQRVMDGVQADMAVLKDRGLGELDSVLLPWGGGPHARLGLEITTRLARAAGADVHVLRVVRPEVETGEEEEKLRQSVETIVGERPRFHYRVRTSADVADGIQAGIDEGAPDLVVIGASSESRIRNVLFGSIPDVVADQAPCSVLMVRRYLPEHWSVRIGQGVKRVRERLRLTSSPETGA
jgi:nucleotide-binding universal stress UspA family protein